MERAKLGLNHVESHVKSSLQAKAALDPLFVRKLVALAESARQSSPGVAVDDLIGARQQQPRARARLPAGFVSSAANLAGVTGYHAAAEVLVVAAPRTCGNLWRDQ